MLNIILIEPDSLDLVSSLLRSQRNFRLHIIEPTGFTLNRPHKRSEVIFYRNWTEFTSRTPKHKYLRWNQSAARTDTEFDFANSWVIVGSIDQGEEFRCSLADSVTALEMLTVVRMLALGVDPIGTDNILG